jgi:hypothetical protein
MTNKITDFFMKEVPEEASDKEIAKGEALGVVKGEALKHECSGCGRKYFMKEEAEKCSGTHDCCAHAKDRKKGFINGIIYGLVPHTFCILFIIGSILGVTLFTSAFKPLLASRNFFYILIALSFSFATLSALFYLKRNNCLCMSGARKRWKFLSILYTTTIAVNLLFFFAIFPAVANIGTASAVSIDNPAGGSYPSLTLNVDIPCSGHAPLIIGELKNLDGVKDVKYVSGKFEVYYDPSKTSKEKILLLEIFKEYPAKVVSENSASDIQSVPAAQTGGGCGGTGGCGAGCCGGK